MHAKSRKMVAAVESVPVLLARLISTRATAEGYLTRQMQQTSPHLDRAQDIGGSLYACNREIKVTGRMLRIARLNADKYHFLLDPRPVIDALKKSGTRIDMFTFLQALPETKPHFDYPMEWDNLAVLPVTTFDNWWNKQIGFKARNKAKQASKKGVDVREVPFDESLARGIWEIYNEAPVRQGRRFPHYGKDLETVYREEATYLESSTFIGAFLNEEMIGFVKLVADETHTQAGLMNILSKLQHRDKAPTNALVAQAVQSCADRGIARLVYSNFSYGKKGHDSVSEFKERNGFQQVVLPRYYVPLTALGWVAFRLGLHRRLVDRLPESVMTKLREARGKWHSRKLRIASEAS
jgi:hypothetical protein